MIVLLVHNNNIMHMWLRRATPTNYNTYIIRCKHLHSYNCILQTNGIVSKTSMWVLTWE